MSFLTQIKAALDKSGIPYFGGGSPHERRSSKRSNHRGRKVLIIDDSTTVIAAMGRILRSASCIVHEAFDAEEGMNLARTKRPDLIFLDIVLPGMSGFSALRLMRRDALIRGIPIIMVSGNEYAIEQFYAKRIGADDFMKKPFSRYEIFVRMDALISAGILAQLGDGSVPLEHAASLQRPEEFRALDNVQPNLGASLRSGRAISQSRETVGFTPLEARSQLNAMGLQYFNQEQYAAAVNRGDKLAVDLFIIGGGIQVNL